MATRAWPRSSAPPSATTAPATPAAPSSGSPTRAAPPPPVPNTPPPAVTPPQSPRALRAAPTKPPAPSPPPPPLSPAPEEPIYTLPNKKEPPPPAKMDPPENKPDETTQFRDDDDKDNDHRYSGWRTYSLPRIAEEPDREAEPDTDDEKPTPSDTGSSRRSSEVKHTTLPEEQEVFWVGWYYIKRRAMIRLCTCLYALIVAVLGIVFPVTYFLSEGDKNHGIYLSIFHFYLYTGSLVFLIYVHLTIIYHKRQMRNCDNNFKMQYCKPDKYKQSENGDLNKSKSGTLESQDGEVGIVLQPRSGLRRTGTLGTMENIFKEGLEAEDLPVYYTANEAPFFMRVGTVIFGLGSVVLDGFRLVQYAHAQEFWHCYGMLFLTHTCLRLIFVFILAFFLFKNHKMVLNFNKHIVRLGFFHVIVTVFCIWALTVVMETAESYYQMKFEGVGQGADFTTPSYTEDEDYILSTSNDHDANSTAGSRSHLVEGIYFLPNSSVNAWEIEDNGSGEEEVEKEEDEVTPYLVQSARIPHCHRTRPLADFAAPYLYPCIIQFVLLAIAIMWRMFRNIGRPAAKTADDKGWGGMQCQKATTGLFLGLLLLTATVISVCFFLLYDPGKGVHPLAKVAPVLVYGAVDLIITCAATGATVFAFLQTQRLYYKDEFGISCNDVLVGIGLTAVYGLIAFMVVPAGSTISETGSLYAKLQIATTLITFVQATIQVIFIIDALRRRSVDRRHFKLKPGRSLVTFLLLCNLCLWLLRSFEWKVANATEVYTNFYGIMAWVIISNLFMPLAIFFRFYSTICLSQVWSNAYKRLDL